VVVVAEEKNSTENMSVVVVEKNNKNVAVVVAEKNRDRYKENVLKETSMQGRCGVNV